MRLLIAVLNKGERLDEIIEGFLRLGVKGATVFDAAGYGEKTLYRFAKISFIRSPATEMLATKPRHKVILSLIKDEVASQAVDLIRETCERWPKTKARVALLPVEESYHFGATGTTGAQGGNK